MVNIFYRITNTWVHSYIYNAFVKSFASSTDPCDREREQASTRTLEKVFIGP